MVTLLRRRRALALGATGLALGLGGCAAADMEAAPAPGAAGPALLTPWLTLDGGWRRTSGLSAAGQRLSFMQPVGVAAQGDLLLVADAAARTLWRLDRARAAMTEFAPFSGSGPEQGASLQLGNDMSVWVALPAEHMVAQFDARGRLVRRWRDDANAQRPVAVAVPGDRGEVLVGDGAGAQVVVFDPLGRTVRLLGDGRAKVLQSLTAMALGPRGLYVLDRVAQQVVVLGARGEVLDVIGEHQLVQPRALAVDRDGRVFVGDDADQRIKVFRGPRLLATAGGMGSGPARFGRIEALAVDGNLLYVADSLNARVQVLLVAPRSMEPRGVTP